MRHRIQSYFSILCLASITFSAAAEEPTQESASAVEEATLQVQGQSFFTDRVIEAYVLFDAEVEAPERPYPASKFVQIVSIEMQSTPGSDQSKSIAVIQFLAKESGLIELPALQFTSDNTTFQTAPLPIRVQAPLESAEMTLNLEPSKRQVYVGEPLRIDLTWQADLDASTLKALRLYPEFFDNPDLEVVIPRNTEPEDRQVGLPIGGRRVIATRSKTPDQPKQLGTISLPIYLRFKSPGIQTLPQTYLECAVLEKTSDDFARYAAYFNNALFEMPDRDDAYRRIFTRAPAHTIEVLPLPEAEQRASFSGLFDPIEIEVSSDQEAVSIGELMELKVLLKSSAPHGMLDLPNLSRQANLRERFVVDTDYGRLWHPEGSEFHIRIRPLSTSIRAIPSLSFQIFDPETGQFKIQRSEPIPLKVNPVDGADHIPLGSIEGATVPLTSQPEGIWHNYLTEEPMNELLNTLHHFANTYFWWLILAGPIGYLLFRPWACRWRRRQTDPQYRECEQAYAEFKRAPSEASKKWPAFIRFLARCYGGNANAWTRHDSESALRSSGLEATDIQTIVNLHEAADANDYGGKNAPVAFQKLDGLAKRIRSLNLAPAILLLLGISLCALPQTAEADSWDEAEALWTEAEGTAAGSDPATNLYQQAALKFQAAAASGHNSGEAWYNAGNAWFQAGAIGRAIAAYRQAAVYRPFDPRLADNLEAARALTLNQVPSEPTSWQRIPKAWVVSALVILNGILWCLLLLHIRFRTRSWRIATATSAALVLIASALLLQKHLSSEQYGVVVVDETLSKKGPSYAYADAFREPLHDGLEFTLLEQRNHWGRIELPDGRECWLPLEQTQLIQN